MGELPLITQIQLKNFKSWANTGDIRLAPLTCFFGTNSSGKSTLIQSLLLMKQTTESSDRKLVLRTGVEGDGLVNLGTVPEIVHKDEDTLDMSVSWELPAILKIPTHLSEESLLIDELNFTTTIHASDNEVYVTQFSYKGKGFFAAVQRESTYSYTVRLSIDGKTDTYPIELTEHQVEGNLKILVIRGYFFKFYGFSPELIRHFERADYLNEIISEFERLFQRVYYLGPLRDYPKRVYSWAGGTPNDVGQKGENAVTVLLARGKQPAYSKPKSPQLEVRVDEWLQEMGIAASFRTSTLSMGGIQYEVRLKRSQKSAEVLLPDMGFGVSQVLPVLVLCYYAPEGSTIILEHPEIHLHPSAQSSLADVFIDVIKNRKLQLIVESHSEHLLRRLQRRIAEEAINVDQTALYFCEMENGASNIKSLVVDEFGNITNWPHDFFGDLTGDLLEMAKSGFERQISQQ